MSRIGNSSPHALVYYRLTPYSSGALYKNLHPTVVLETETTFAQYWVCINQASTSVYAKRPLRFAAGCHPGPRLGNAPERWPRNAAGVPHLLIAAATSLPSIQQLILPDREFPLGRYRQVQPPLLRSCRTYSRHLGRPRTFRECPRSAAFLCAKGAL